MEIKEIKMNKIKLGSNCRVNIPEEDLSGLMQAIKSQGLLQPVGVVEQGTGYELAYGNRRFLACSKLGWKEITCVIVPANGAYDRDLKNLTENVQRKNISLIEAGRFIELLRAQDLTYAEIAVRMGVAVGYVATCAKAFSDVPSEFREHIQLAQRNEKIDPGKIAVSTVSKILNARKEMRLSYADTRSLLKEARENPDFSEASIPKYAQSIKSGIKKDFVKKTKPVFSVRVQFLISGDEHQRLRSKHIKDGPFKSMTALIMAILRGDKSERIKIL